MIANMGFVHEHSDAHPRFRWRYLRSPIYTLFIRFIPFAPGFVFVGVGVRVWVVVSVEIGVEVEVEVGVGVVAVTVGIVVGIVVGAVAILPVLLLGPPVFQLTSHKR